MDGEEAKGGTSSFAAGTTSVRFGLEQRQTFQLVSYVEPESA
jgi:hypothetical protein